jgi:N6-L-threonylcarbamoyladenine synthase
MQKDNNPPPCLGVETSVDNTALYLGVENSVGNTPLYLGVETSCDETSVAVVDGDFNILSNIVSSQIDIHKQYGGVVPEIASRNHIENIIPVLDTALKTADVTLPQIRKVYATAEPGLPGAVMVGRTAAESLATALKVEYVPINHLYGHIGSLKLSNKDLQPPFMALLVSGGHTAIYMVWADWKTKLLLATADDAVGECFDKVGRMLGMDYPAGAKISKEAEKYTEEYKKRYTEKYAERYNEKPTEKHNNENEYISFVSKLPKDGFSFSGLKTAVMNFINTERMAGRELNIPKICYSFQKCVTDQLINRTITEIKKHRIVRFGICGGVAVNKYLRERMQNECEKLGVQLYVPLPELCGDNGAMIAAAGILNII